MERELVMSGVGGQGVQLASSVLAFAAVHEGLEVQLFGSYGGMMRGGSTEATLVFGEASVEAPPTLSQAWSVILMHLDYSEHARSCTRRGGLLFTNSTVIDEEAVERSELQLLAVPATDIAMALGNAMVASMVMIGAYVAATGIVEVGSLSGALAQSIPPYRRQHLELNEKAIAAGSAAVERLSAPAWEKSKSS